MSYMRAKQVGVSLGIATIIAVGYLATSGQYVSSGKDTLAALLGVCSEGQSVQKVSGVWTCATASGGTVTGTGTANKTTKFTGPGAVGNGWALDDGTTWGVSSKFTITEATGAAATPMLNGLALYIDNGASVANFFWNKETTYTPGAGAAGNFGMGLHALHSLTTGINNLAIGWDSQFVNLTGSNNVSVGEDALKYVTGDGNTALGYTAGYSISSGLQNTAVGPLSLYNLTTGGYNTAIGHTSATGLTTTANRNVAVGYGTFNTVGNTASYSTAVGYNAARTNVNETNAVVVGAGALLSGNGTDNEIVIGANATGAGANTATFGNASIATTMLRGAVITANASGPQFYNVAASSTVPTLIPNRASTTTGIGAQASGNLSLIAGGTEVMRVTSGGVAVIGSAPLTVGIATFATVGTAAAFGSTSRIGWSSTADPSIAPDVGIARAAASALEINNGTPGTLAGIRASNVRLGSSAGPFWQSGTGSPESVYAAPVGSFFSRTDGGAGTTFYVKESGAGNTGWVAK